MGERIEKERKNGEGGKVKWGIGRYREGKKSREGNDRGKSLRWEKGEGVQGRKGAKIWGGGVNKDALGEI
jgi:hypothetical protein